MADFTEAYWHTSAREGGYAHDPIDRGGETYRGISRVCHPGWDGWNRVDALKVEAGFPGSLESDAGLRASVEAFYKEKYWDRFLGDEIPSQQVAVELFDTGVNMGVRRSVRFLQNGLNLLNRNQENYQDLVVDGWLGQRSLELLSKYLNLDGNSDALIKLMNIQQGARYVGIMEHDSSQEKYARGWLRRV
mgnify:FL=1